jgi:hypothetical protein
VNSSNASLDFALGLVSVSFKQQPDDEGMNAKEITS